MTRPVVARTLVGAAVVAALAASAGCAGSPPPKASGSPAATPTRGGTSPSASPTSKAGTDRTPTCDTILDPATVADFAKIGWSSQQDVFRIGSTEVAGGIQCTWGDLQVASDNVQIFGWAPIDSSTATAAEQDLLAQGWRRVDDAGSVFITEDSSTAINTDDQGFGWTYEFGDGWVEFADTKQGLLLISWPPAG